MKLKKIDCKKVFNISCPFDVYGFAEKSEYVPAIDENYLFDEKTTLAILAGFAFNGRVLIQGMHGTGKSTHIEQVAARLNWPCMRINFDSQITRLDLVGKDVIKLKNDKQITEFKEGIIPFVLRGGIALVLDEYDAIKTDVSFVIQRLLEEEGKFALLEENEIITPNKFFRLFATSNTLGAGDDLGIYHGTNLINQAQMDRWNIVAALNYLDEKHEIEILLKKLPFLNSKLHQQTARMMVRLANLTREAFKNGDISTLISLRTLISWGRNIEIFSSVENAFILSFLNKVIDEEKLVIKEFYQRVFAKEI
jgi:cobaltochelatase CobS